MCSCGLPPTAAELRCGVQLQTVPYLMDNPELGYVQTRWVFANPEESYLTKVGVGPGLHLRGSGSICLQVQATGLWSVADCCSRSHRQMLLAERCALRLVKDNTQGFNDNAGSKWHHRRGGLAAQARDHVQFCVQRLAELLLRSLGRWMSIPSSTCSSAGHKLNNTAAQAQEISLNYHCKCEQYVHFAGGGFFNFNGTAGQHRPAAAAAAVLYAAASSHTQHIADGE